MELTARKIKAISKGLDCKLKKIKDIIKKRRIKQNLEKKIRTIRARNEENEK